MPWARASSLDRHLVCPAASTLPRADRGRWSLPYVNHGDEVHAHVPPPADDATLAEWGTQMHLAKARPDLAADPWLSWMAPHRERLWPGRTGAHEVTASYNCRTGAVDIGPINVESEEADAWKAARSTECVVGTLDWLALLVGGEPWVDDLKTGWPVPSVTTGQMEFAALVGTTLHKAASCVVSVTHWRRGEPAPTRAGLWRRATWPELSEFQMALEAAWRAATGRKTYAVPGPHCKYCPSALVCPRANE